MQNEQLISTDQARVVVLESAISGKSTKDVLLETEFVSQAALEKYQTGPLSIALDVEEFVPDTSAINLLTEATARALNVLPVTYDKLNNLLILAVEDPGNIVTRDRVSRALGAHVGAQADTHLGSQVGTEFRRANLTDIHRALDKCYGMCHSLQGILSELEHHALSHLNDTLEHTPVVRLIDALLQDAITRRASDMHFSPEAQYVQVRYRVDGVLQVACCLHIKYWSALLVRIKVLSGLDIAETRLPQDGHIARRIHGQLIHFRVASFPLSMSENLVLRVLDRQRGLLPLASLCSDKKTEHALRTMMQQPDGLVMVCGPTGSGKTTTLYSLLATLDAKSLNIMTLEDPVEYPMAHIQQTRVQSQSVFDFSEGVRGVLRQDPDVILVGEIRDKDSCSMTCRAAMTGHLVLSSTHADNCVGAIARLVDLGAQTSVVANVLRGIVSQRLIRRLCQHCVGTESRCGACAGTGYSGRIALFEILIVSQTIRALLLEGASLAQLQSQANEEGMVPLVEMAMRCVNQNQTDQAEIQRVFG